MTDPSQPTGTEPYVPRPVPQAPGAPLPGAPLPGPGPGPARAPGPQGQGGPPPSAPTFERPAFEPPAGMAPQGVGPSFEPPQPALGFVPGQGASPTPPAPGFQPPAVPMPYAAPTADHPTAYDPADGGSAPVTGAAHAALNALRAEVAKAVVAQDAAVSALVVALLCRGHILLEGVPGTAKTLLVRSFATAMSIDTRRVQFTPDLMPGDITGSLVYDARTAAFEFREGPVFTNLLLADEINRTPPKTQAALLEAMEERQVTVDGHPRPLPDPFIVAATQNPVEFDGTYPLPEAQLDRFLLKVRVDLPDRGSEIEILTRHSQGFDPRDLAGAGLSPVAGVADLEAARAEIRTVQVHPAVLAYVVDVVRATRSTPALQLGVSPRGATALLATSRAWAWLAGRRYVTPDDVKALSLPVLRHRVALRPEAELEGASADSVIESILASVPVPR